MTSGILQLNDNTELLLDETKLKAGKLNESGVRAVGALSNVVQSQTVCYDFGFNVTQEFNCDIPFLILSEGKSMLPVRFFNSIFRLYVYVKSISERFSC